MNEYLAILRRLQDVQRTAVEKEKEKIKNISVQDHLLSNQSPPEQDIVRVQLQQQHKQYLLEVRERQQVNFVLSSSTDMDFIPRFQYTLSSTSYMWIFRH